MYLSIFTKTFAALAATALLAAQALKWDTPADVRTSAMVLAFSLIMAAIGGVLAVLWAFVGQPAVTPLGRAIRSAVQALLAAPATVLVANAAGWTDFAQLSNMLVPTVVAVVLAFLISLASNYAPVPIGAKPLGNDVTGTSPSI